MTEQCFSSVSRIKVLKEESVIKQLEIQEKLSTEKSALITAEYEEREAKLRASEKLKREQLWQKQQMELEKVRACNNHNDARDENAAKDKESSRQVM